MDKYLVYDDDQLLRFLQQNDELAFSEIYTRYWKRLYEIAYSYFRDTYLSEDIVHDIFASLWKNRHRQEIVSLHNYLAVATKYLVFAKIKKTNKHKVLHNTPTLQCVEDDTTLNHIVFKELVEQVNKEVKLLPEKCRLVFTYKEKGFSNQEIATIMNISQKTVENHTNRAFSILRFSLKKLLSFLL